MPFVPRPQEIYRHFKGNLYQIVTIAEHSETGEKLVIYQALYGDYKFYARPLEMFASKVDRTKYPNCAQEFRFELQGEDKDRQKREASETEGKPEPEKETVAEVKPAFERETVTAEPEKETEEEKSQLQTEAQAEEEPQLDPLILEFLDSKTYEEKLNVLAALHHRITDDMITTMAVATDVEVADGELEERYAQLKNCLQMLEKYECNRLR